MRNRFRIGNGSNHRRCWMFSMGCALASTCISWLSAAAEPAMQSLTTNNAIPQQRYPEIAAQLAQLRPPLSGYPPSFQNDFERVTTQKRYALLKKQLDTLLSKQPNDAELWWSRAELQRLGHNMDQAGALDGAAADYQHLLALAPNHLDGLLGFGQLLVNSSPENAGSAAELFAHAQCLTPDAPNEAAQQGYFFALYYQGQLQSALQQALYLQQMWPSAPYQQLVEVTRAALQQGADATSGDATSQLPPCQY